MKQEHFQKAVLAGLLIIWGSINRIEFILTETLQAAAVSFVGLAVGSLLLIWVAVEIGQARWGGDGR